MSHPGNSLRTHESREAGLWGEVDFEIEIMVNVIFRKGMINSVTVPCLQLADIVCRFFVVNFIMWLFYPPHK